MEEARPDVSVAVLELQDPDRETPGGQLRIADDPVQFDIETRQSEPLDAGM